MRVMAMGALAETCGLKPDILVTRLRGRQFLPALETILQDLPDDDGLLLDFGGVEILDASFADEVFGALAAARGRRRGVKGCLVLAAIDQAVLENIEMALQTRPIRERGLRNCVLPVLQAGEVILIGKAEEHVNDTFRHLLEQHQLTARELADALELDITAASTRLKVIFDLGLATRQPSPEGMGKQYVYGWPD